MPQADPHRLPDLREFSPFGRLLRRYLLPFTLVFLGLLVWAAIYTVDVLDLDLQVPAPPSPTQPHGP